MMMKMKMGGWVRLKSDRGRVGGWELGSEIMMSFLKLDFESIIVRSTVSISMPTNSSTLELAPTAKSTLNMDGSRSGPDSRTSTETSTGSPTLSGYPVGRSGSGGKGR